MDASWILAMIASRLLSYQLIQTQTITTKYKTKFTTTKLIDFILVVVVIVVVLVAPPCGTVERTSKSRTRETVFESCAAVSTFRQVLHSTLVQFTQQYE